jgi:hypothetical protein
MARKLRVQYPGAVCHVMNGGDGREPIFLDDKDRGLLLKTLDEACLRREKTMTLAWIAERLHMGGAGPRCLPALSK